MIDNLRREHFKLGEEQSYKTQSSKLVGGGAHLSAKAEKVPWASLRTNYELGTDKQARTTDYQNRFAQTHNNFRSQSMSNPHDECKQNKAKMTSDSVTIAGNAHQDTTVSSRIQFQNTFGASQKLNTGLDKLTTSYITGSHFKPGYGGFGGMPENKRAFASPIKNDREALSPDRIKFFKDAHFDFCDRSQAQVSMTSMKGSYHEKDMSGKRSINDGNNAYSLRHKVHDHGKIGGQSVNYVSYAQMRYRWIQPKRTDMGTTASMGLVKDKQK